MSSTRTSKVRGVVLFVSCFFTTSEVRILSPAVYVPSMWQPFLLKLSSVVRRAHVIILSSIFGSFVDVYPSLPTPVAVAFSLTDSF